MWEEGIYENCNVQFVMHPDDKNGRRVAPVRSWTNFNQGWGVAAYACTGLLEVPR